jgi:hypothetical protein
MNGSGAVSKVAGLGPASSWIGPSASIRRRFLEVQTSLAFARALAKLLFFFWHMRSWFVYACGAENVRLQTHVWDHAGGKSIEELEVAEITGVGANQRISSPSPTFKFQGD